MIRPAATVGLWSIVFAALAPPGSGQTPSSGVRTDPQDPTPVAQAVERAGEIEIDGRLSDAAWALAPVATGFVQREPVEGQPAEESTEVRIVFDETAVYVGARLYDANPDGIARQLVRRDGRGHGRGRPGHLMRGREARGRGALRKPPYPRAGSPRVHSEP